MTQIRNEEPCPEVRPSTRNKIHRVLKLGRESESNPKHGSTCQRGKKQNNGNANQGPESQRLAIPNPVNPQPESPNARSSAPKTP